MWRGSHGKSGIANVKMLRTTWLIDKAFLGDPKIPFLSPKMRRPSQQIDRNKETFYIQTEVFAVQVTIHIRDLSFCILNISFIHQVHFQDGKECAAIKELYSLLKDHRNP